MRSTKLVLRGAAALAVLALAAPALPCGDMKQQTSATNEKAAPSTPDTVASKSTADKAAASKAKPGTAKKTPTATN